MAQENTHTTAESAREYMKNGYEEELKRTEALDSKSDLMVTFAGFLTGMEIALVSLAYDDLRSVFISACGLLRLFTGILLVAANSSFLGATLCAVASSAARKYWSRLVFEAEDIERWTASESQTEMTVFFAKQFQAHWLHNRVENDTKAKWLRISTTFLSAGTTSLTLGALLVLVILFF